MLDPRIAWIFNPFESMGFGVCDNPRALNFQKRPHQGCLPDDTVTRHALESWTLAATQHIHHDRFNLIICVMPQDQYITRSQNRLKSRVAGGSRCCFNGASRGYVHRHHLIVDPERRTEVSGCLCPIRRVRIKLMVDMQCQYGQTIRQVT